MPNIMKVACSWRRKVDHYIYAEGPDTFPVSYLPKSLAVQYRDNEEGLPVVEKALVFSDECGPADRKVIKKLTDIPANMYQSIARIVQANEFGYGRAICSVIMPNGEKAYA